MRLLKRILPFLVSLVVTPFALWAGLFSAGMGHGNYVIVTLLFPFTILGAICWQALLHPPFGDSEPRDTIMLVSALIQFPIYGLLFSIVKRKALLAITILVLQVILFAFTFGLGYRTGFL